MASDRLVVGSMKWGWYKGWTIYREKSIGDNQTFSSLGTWMGKGLRGEELKAATWKDLKAAIEQFLADKQKRAFMQTEADDPTVKSQGPEKSQSEKLKDKGVTPWWIKQSDSGSWSAYQSGSNEKEKAAQGQHINGPFISKKEADDKVAEKQAAAQSAKQKEQQKKQEESAMLPFRSFLTEEPTRKEFQMVADLIKANPDAGKRYELAKHHAEIFAKQNPRFDRQRFFAAANVLDIHDRDTAGNRI